MWTFFISSAISSTEHSILIEDDCLIYSIVLGVVLKNESECPNVLYSRPKFVWVRILSTLLPLFSKYLSAFLEIQWDKMNLGLSVTLLRKVSFWDCTGSAIKNRTHYLNHACSHDRNPSNFKSTFRYYHTELSFEVYNIFLDQLA